VVGHEGHHRLAGQASLLQPGQQPPHLVVGGRDFALVEFHQPPLLRGGEPELFAGLHPVHHTAGLTLLHEGANGCALRSHGTGVKRFPGLVVGVGIHVVEVEEKGAVPVMLEPGKGNVGHGPGLARVDGTGLGDKGSEPLVEPVGRSDQQVVGDGAGEPPGIMKSFGHGFEIAGELQGVHITDAVPVGVEAGKQRGHRWRGPRGTGLGVTEQR